MEATCPCPKCNRTLKQSGFIEMDGQKLPTFQCDECIMVAKVLGEDFEMALTFALDANGQVFDPASPDGKLRF